MELEKYSYLANQELLSYEFESVGPKGGIRKVVRFTARNANGITYFNLGFGDLDVPTGKIDDLAKSDNNDRDKVLATIAAIVLDFTSIFPDIMIYAKGSSPARTRLYQISIAANFDDIEAILDVFGFTRGEWEPFVKNTNYEAFLILRKKT